VLALETKDEARLIRRAYLDVLGVVPTAGELEWYCVYNTDGYIKAVEYILRSSAMRLLGEAALSRKRTALLSDEYKQAASVKLSQAKLEDIIYYLSGYKGEHSAEALRKAKLALIAHARVYEDGDLEAIDRISLGLMGRVTKLDEANSLLRILRCGLDVMSEEESWLNALEQLLLLEDVRSK
jgi:hypothetical protein